MLRQVHNKYYSFVFRHQEYMILITADTELHSVSYLLDTGHFKLNS